MVVLKKYGWIIILAVIAIGFFIYRRLKQKISFGFSMDSNTQNILNSISGTPVTETGRGIGINLDIPVTTIIKNSGAARVVLENIAGSILYNGEPIMQTKQNSAALQSVPIEGKSSAIVTDNLQLLINPSTIKFFTEFIKGNKPQVKYNFSTIVFGKPQIITNQTTINQVDNITAQRRNNYFHGKLI